MLAPSFLIEAADHDAALERLFEGVAVSQSACRQALADRTKVSRQPSGEAVIRSYA